MDRHQFRLFLKRYAENKCTPEEIVLIDHWYELIGDDVALSSMQENEWAHTEERLWQKISASALQPAAPAKRFRMTPLRWAAAAAISGVIIAGALFFSHNRPMTAEQIYAAAGDTHFTEATNNTASSRRIRLEDGTVIILYPGAAMKYPQHFNTTRREVYLKGKAMFDVEKDANRPFYVYSAHLVTHVLGTSFTIDPDKDGGQIQVSVHNGRVEIYEQHTSVAVKQNAGNSGVILTPNQRVIYRQSESSFETTLVEAPEPVVTQNNETGDTGISLQFSDDPISMVINALEKYYGVEIVVDNENLYNCPFTGALTQQGLYEKLAVVCQSVGASYEIKGTRILIRGKGCN
ncbi:FecR family protein [Chitinophaga tropicalis]|uniref:DUF4974 domain-containing protein n=1 Tax=Chitinophaga tropicalis TaxID=2683588 RepID=A0A7K1UD50_9BACT|nr:FecR family protein [Chitinophaga tropicalis]MVT12301.1 DUF4974 domain-containing protein [Chitinophaga tropicalis]